MKNKITKIFFSVFSLIMCLSLFIPHTQASAVEVGSIATSATTGAMNDALNDLGVNKTELKYIIQTMNVQRRKKQQPQVSLNFNPSNPVPGQKVTAVATPMYFLNTDKDLYFTWYLKSDGCPEKSSGLSDTQKDKCDLDDDGDIDINDYKIKAARIFANNDFEYKNENYGSDSDSDGYSAVWGGNDQKGKNNFCYIHDTESGDEYPITCDHHLFAEKSDTAHDTGDGSFGKDEEKFWHTDPNDPDTADTGNGDEANVAGLGATSFSWVYEEGDEIGVVVEGISIEATQEADSSYKIMFATLNNSCDLNYTDKYPITETVSDTPTVDTPDPGQTTRVIVTTNEVLNERAAFYAKTTTTTTTRTIVTTTADGTVISDTSSSTTASPVYKNIDSSYYPNNVKNVTDLDKCLPENMIDPMQGGGTKEKMEVELSSSPEAPMNDSTTDGQDGDKVTINSSVLNANNDSYLNYSWQVYKSSEANPDDWGDPITKARLKESTQTSGIGIDSLNFRLNFSDTDTFYLKVKLTVKENISSKSVREGHNYIVIPVTSATEKIKAYKTTIANNASGNPIVSMSSTELCGSGIDKSVCPVVKDQIIGLKVPAGMSDFSWTINGEQFSYSTCFFEGCDLSKQTNVAYFPILDEPGEQYTIGLTATDITSGKKVNLTRYFQVVEPEVKIATADETICKPVLLGYYTDYDGKKWPDNSKDDFEAIAGEKIKLTANFTGFIPEGENYGWIVDGVGINTSNAKTYGYEINSNNELVIPAKVAGETTTVGIAAKYFPNTLTKKALNAYWGVNYGGFYETEVGDSIDITSVDSFSGSSVSKNTTGKNKIMASLFSSTPTYIAFLFRIVLTGALLLFFSGFILSFFPNIKERQI
ncbi:MAG: hypothetical protein WCV59_01785 [Parcubacteria group bacterium]|jgi:hypothetical protein